MKRGIELRTASGVETDEFQFFETLVVEVGGLTPRAGYDLAIVDAEGTVQLRNRLSADARGRIPETALWYAIGVRPCWRDPRDPREVREGGRLAYADITDRTVAGAYSLRVSRQGEAPRSASFRVSAQLLRPILYAADAHGCPKTGFLLGEEDVWVVGHQFPPGALLRLWAVDDEGEWRDGEPLEDQTHQYGFELPPLVELAPGETSFRRPLWPGALTSLGSYDIVAETVAHDFGTYRDRPEATARHVIADLGFSGFVIQRRPDVAEPLEIDIAGAVSSPFAFRSTFLTTENMYVGVDPALQPSFVGQTADVYIVADKTDAQWATDPSLTDVTGTVETLSVNGICGNCWKTLAWTAPLTIGRYDVVLDFNQDGVYTPGTDLIDSLDPAGFTVSDVRVDRISFRFPGSDAIELYDHVEGGIVVAPEYVSAGHVVRPAAWVMGGSHSVQVKFSAIPSVSSAQIHAAGGLGGLASDTSPVTVSFTGGSGTASFAVNSPPATVARTEFHWDWKRRIGGSSAEMGSTGRHLLYTVLDTPQAPQSTPWVGALEVATTVAQGETTAAAATRKVWSELYHNAGGLYDTVGGAPRYTGSTSNPFNLTQFLANYAVANIGVVNCYDMGKSVMILSNALGAGAEYTYTGPFGYLNLVKPIGRGWANNPFYNTGNSFYSSDPVVNGDWELSDGRTSFGNHAFTRVAGQIFDASGGQADTDSDPDALPAGAPRLLDGNDSWSSSYRDRVIDDVPASNPGTPTVYQFTVY